MLQRVPAVLGLIVLVIFFAAPISAQSDNEIFDWFEKGFEAFDQRDYKMADFYFEKILQKEPSSDLALRLRERIGVQRLLDLMAPGGRRREFAIYILEKSHFGEVPRIRETNEILRLVETSVRDEDFAKRWEAVLYLDARVGANAVPHFVTYLADERDESARVNAIMAIRKMGEQATLPVLELLNADSSRQMLRQNAIIILGHLEDPRALPALVQISQSSTEAALTKRYANQSIGQITGGTPVSGTAKDLYLEQAKAYYQNDSRVVSHIGAGSVLWSWNEGAEDLNQMLVQRTVPNYLWNELEAEKSCFAALALDHDYLPAWALLVSTYFAQVNETSAILDASRVSKRNQPSANEMQMLESNQTILTKLDSVASIGSLDVLYAALEQAISDGRSLVGVRCIESIADLESNKNSPHEAMLTALQSQDKRLQYTAALALAHIDPLQPFAGHDQVVPALEAALGEAGVRSILVISDHEPTRDGMVHALNSVGYAAYGAETGVHGVEMAHRFPRHDLVILDTGLGVHRIDVDTGGATRESTQYFLKIYHQLRGDFRTRETPVVFLVSPEEEEDKKANFQDQVQGFIRKENNPGAYTQNATAYKDTFAAEIFEGINDDFKARAEDIARRAAEALSQIDTDHSLYQPGQALQGMIAVLESQADSIRIPTINALGNLGNAEALAPLIRVARDTANKTPVRAAAMEAMGDIWRAGKLSPSADAQTLLMAELEKGNAAIQRAASHALGRGSIDNRTRLQFFSNNRVKVVPTGGNDG